MVPTNKDDTRELLSIFKKHVPKFMIIGFSSCGTSSIVRNLNKHPEIYIPTKEVWFFAAKLRLPRKIWYYAPNTTHQNLREYLQLFKPDRINGEKTPVYIVDQAAMQIIQKLFPRIKIIICIRHPIQSLHSQYNHQAIAYTWKSPGIAGINSKKISFDNIVLKNLDIEGVSVSGRCYIKFIKENVLRYFDRSQIHIVIQEQMWKNTRGTVNNILNFLNKESLELEFERSKKYDCNYRYNLINYDSDSYIKSIERLRNFYKPYNKELFEFLGKEIPEWMKFDDLYSKFVNSDR